MPLSSWHESKLGLTTGDTVSSQVQVKPNLKAPKSSFFSHVQNFTHLPSFLVFQIETKKIEMSSKSSNEESDKQHFSAEKLYNLAESEPHPIQDIKVQDGKTNGMLEESLPLNESETSCKSSSPFHSSRFVQFIDPEDIYMFIRGYAKEEDVESDQESTFKTLKWRQNIGYDQFLMKFLPQSDRFTLCIPRTFSVRQIRSHCDMYTNIQNQT